LNLIKGELDYLFNNWFDFNNDLDNYFTGGSAANDGIRNLSIAAVYAIFNYNNNKTQSKYKIIKDFDNNITQSNFKITRDFSNFKNSAFYKLGLNLKIPPVRIIFKNFED